MTPLTIHLEGDNAFSFLSDEPTTGEFRDVACLADGTVGGKPSIALLIKLPDGSHVFAQTTWALWHAATRAFEAKLGRPE